jgi:hypothetical protein
MKKLNFLSMLALFALFVVSCTDTKPILKFNLTVSADVEEPKTKISVNSVSEITNDRWMYFPAPDDMVLLAVTEKATEINDWVNDMIENNIIPKLPEKAIYRINVVGWVKETNTGLMIFVDKTFSNNAIKAGKNNCLKLIE